MGDISNCTIFPYHSPLLTRILTYPNSMEASLPRQAPITSGHMLSDVKGKERIESSRKIEGNVVK